MNIEGRHSIDLY